jgi:multiple sugar transport system permease protein
MQHTTRNTHDVIRNTQHARRNTQRRNGLWALLAPYLVGTIVLSLAPAVLSLALAFTEYDALSPPVWHGLRNFHDIFSDELFLISLRNSAFFVLLAVPLRLGSALALALLLNQRRRGVGAYRVAVYLPTVVPDVAYALIWLWIFNPIYGPLNQALSALGLPAPVWLLQPDTARLAIVIMSLFQIGEGFVVLLAGRQEIPPDYYHAAAVDGASAWQMFRLITLPLLAPWLLALTIRDALLSAQSTFTPALLMTGGPYYATLFTPLLVYQEAFDRFRFGRAAAMMLVLLLGLGLLLWLVGLVARGWGEDEEGKR